VAIRGSHLVFCSSEPLPSRDVVAGNLLRGDAGHDAIGTLAAKFLRDPQAENADLSEGAPDGRMHDARLVVSLVMCCEFTLGEAADLLAERVFFLGREPEHLMPLSGPGLQSPT
jgi:hypothetical protein